MGASITPKGTGLYDLYKLWVTMADLFKQYTSKPPTTTVPASAPSGWVGRDSQNTQSQLLTTSLPTITLDPCASAVKSGAFSSDQYIYKLAECCQGRNPPGKTCVALAKSWEAAKMTLPDGYNLGDLQQLDSIMAGINANASGGVLTTLSVGGNSAMDNAIRALMQARVKGVLNEMYSSSSTQKLRLGSLTTKPVTQTATMRLGNLSVQGTKSPVLPTLYNAAATNKNASVTPNLTGIMKYFKVG